MNELALFAGAGGGILGGKLLGWATVCGVEIDPYAAAVMAARQNEGALDPFPIWDNIQTFDGRSWRGVIDVVSGGFPCQDISAAGRGEGISGKRSGLWGEMARIIGEVRPRYVFVENSPMLITRGLGTVLGDLATLGYDCRWTVLGAANVGALHKRDRFWLVAHSNELRELQSQRRECEQRRWSGNGGETMADTDSHTWHERWQSNAEEIIGRSNVDRSRVEQTDMADASRIQPGRSHEWAIWQRTWQSGQSIALRDTDSERPQERQSVARNTRPQQSPAIGADWWELEPGLGRVANAVANRVDRLKCIGNGQVPICAATAWRILTADL